MPDPTDYLLQLSPPIEVPSGVIDRLGVEGNPYELDGDLAGQKGVMIRIGQNLSLVRAEYANHFGRALVLAAGIVEIIEAPDVEVSTAERDGKAVVLLELGGELFELTPNVSAELSARLRQKTEEALENDGETRAQ